jgi:hypothetical protein
MGSVSRIVWNMQINNKLKREVHNVKNYTVLLIFIQATIITVISDKKDRRVNKKRLSNKPDVIRSELEPYRNEFVGIVGESHFNWYWLVILLMEEGC